MKTFSLNERKKAVLDVVCNDPIGEAAIKELVGGTKAGLTSKAIRALFEEGTLKRTSAGRKGDPYLYCLDTNRGGLLPLGGYRPRNRSSLCGGLFMIFHSSTPTVDLRRPDRLHVLIRSTYHVLMTLSPIAIDALRVW